MPPKLRSKPSDWKKNKLLAAPVKGCQLEAAVRTSLPPLVKGSLRGHLVVSLEGGIVWEYRVGPPTPKLCIQLKWWGEKSPGTMFRVPVQVSSGSKNELGDHTSLAYFPIRSAVSQLSSYLNDMGSLTFLVGLGHMTDSSMVIGQAVVPNIKQLTPNSPLKGSYPVVNSSGVCLGKLCVHIRIELSAQLNKESTKKQRKVNFDQPEFIVGPGVRFGGSRAHGSPLSSPSKDVGTVVGGQDRVGSSHGHSSAPKETHTPTDRGELEGCVLEGTELGARQIEVISELIERGQQLRNRMVESIVTQGGNGGERETVGGESLSTGLTGLNREVRGGVGADLLACGIDINTNSDEDCHISSDVSSDESDYPLHNEALLSALYSLNNPHPASGEVNGLNHPKLSGVSVNLYEPDSHHLTSLQEERGEIGEKASKVAMVTEDQSSTAADKKPPKLSSKLSSLEQAVIATAVSGVSQESDDMFRKGVEPDKDSNTSSSVASTHGQGDKAKPDSLATLSSYFVKGQGSLESAMVSAIGLEKLTQLGRVGSARITVGSLKIDPSFAQQVLTHCRETKRNGQAGSNIPLPSHSTKSPTYFVEYQFPAVLNRSGAGSSVRRLPNSHELMRIASKKMKDGVVKFNHHSVFPLEFNSSVLRHWWNSALIFRVYCRPHSQRMPSLVGKAVLPLKQLLAAKSPSNGHFQLKIKSSTLAEAVKERETDDAVVGSLEVSLEFVQSGGRGSPLVMGRAEKEGESVLGSTSEAVSDPPQPSGRSGAVEECGDEEQSSPIHLREKDINTREVSAKPPALQLLMLIPEAIDVSTHSPSPSPSLTTDLEEKLSAPNSYLICKLFCAKPYPHTPVLWATQNPQFNFKQLFALYLTPALLNQVANNFTVVEVWHRTPGAHTDDELIGLVKLSLHQFYLAFSDEESVQLCSQAELPVVAIDCYCPIVNPFSGHIAGHLAVLLALGTNPQISHLQQLYASGQYSLQLPHRAHTGVRRTHQDTSTKPGGSGIPPALCAHQGEDVGAVEHVFTVCIEGVREMTAFASTVWGEADCFVQYHFPSVSSDDDDEHAEMEASLHPYRTGTTLCVPNPSFSHEAQHTLSLNCGEPVQKYIMAACGRGLGGVVPFELWRRFYYPNIRDQLVARASLPVAKLCALVTMRGANSCSTQDFPLPLKLVADDNVATDDCGVLDVSVRYEALHSSDEKNSRDSQHVSITVAILRAAGLKDAATLVAPDNPVTLGLAAEVGVNAYVTISLPGIVKEKRMTKTIAHSFSPEFSHVFDLALPLTFHPTKASTTSVTLAQKLAEGCIFVEVWHQSPKRGSSSLTGVWQSELTGSGSSVVTGRRLAPGARDVLLGRLQVPLLQLLQRSTGIHGWYPLEPTSSNIEEQGCFVGGLELSVTFTSEDARELVLTTSLRRGWTVPNSFFTVGTPLPTQLGDGHHAMSTGHAQKQQLLWLEEKSVRFEFDISHANLQLSVVDIPTTPQPTHKFCFIRYRFFDTKPVVTTPKPITCSREGIATYQLNHRAQLHLTSSSQLQWYLSEECMEVQVWASLTKRQHSESPRPSAEDTLLGSAYIPLNDIIISEDLGGDFPLFKAGVDRLGGQSLHVAIRRTVLPSEGAPLRPVDARVNCMEILDSSEDEADSPSMVARAEGEEKRGNGEEKEESPRGKKLTTQGEEDEDKVEEMVQDTFSARVVIHEALHLPVCRAEPRAGGVAVPPSPYVTAHPHPNVDKITTATVAESRSPVWDHQCTTRVPNHYLHSQSQGLEFQVWSKNISTQQDSYLGSAHVDLCPLACGLSHLCGWYNITDFGGQTQGQLKISIAPTERISYPSPLLAYSSLTSATGSLHSRLPSASVIRGDAQLALSTEPLLAEDKVDHVSSQTRSTLFQQLREDIQQLESIQKDLLTRLDRRDTPGHLASQITLSHHEQPQEMPTSVSRLMVAPPTAPPTLTSAGGGRTYSVPSPPPPVQRGDHELHMSTTTTPSERNSHSPDSPTQSELPSVSVREKSISRDETHSSSEDDENDRQPSFEGSPTPLVAGSRSGSLTDVSTCSEASSTKTSLSQGKPTVVPETNVDRQSPSQHESEQRCSDFDSASEHSSIGKNHQSLEEEEKDTSTNWKNQPPSSEDLFPPPGTTLSYPSSHHSTAMTTLATHPAPLVTITTATTAATPFLTHPSPNSLHDSTLHQQTVHLHTHEPNQPSEYECSEDTSTGVSKQPPPPAAVKLPNFFMTPEQLEESMRTLRAGALSRAPPKTCSDQPPSATHAQHVQCHRDSVATHLKTLQEVRAYLESRRTAERPPNREITTAETQRLARILSS